MRLGLKTNLTGRHESMKTGEPDLLHLDPFRRQKRIHLVKKPFQHRVIRWANRDRRRRGPLPFAKNQRALAERDDAGVGRSLLGAIGRKITRQVSAMKQRLSGEITLLAHQPASFPSSETKAAATMPSISAIFSKALFTAPFHVLVPQLLGRPGGIEDPMADAQVIGHQNLLQMRPEQRHVAEIIDLKGHGDVGHLAINKGSDEGAPVRFSHLRALEQVRRRG